MFDKKITRDISAGMYVLSSGGYGCMVDTVMQVSSGEIPLISVSVNKNNYTHNIIKENGKFAISILGMNVDPEIIKTFGFASSSDIDKFMNISYDIVDDIKIIKGSIGYIICELTDMVDVDTHTVFIGKMIRANRFDDVKPMTYNYYQENKKDLLKLEMAKGKKAYVCSICGYIYYGDNLPDDFICPKCGVSKDYFIASDN